MNISIVGTGYVGLVTAAIFADFGHNVSCIDIDAQKINSLKQLQIPFYEPGLKEFVERNIQHQRLSFSTNYSSITSTKAVFICVGTPPTSSGKANTAYLFSAIKQVALHTTKSSTLLLVIKSTVPLNLETKIQSIIKKYAKGKIEIASCPEFLREGSAIEDSLQPDRIVIGTDSKSAANLLLEIYKPIECNKLITDIRSAQLIKYAANAFLASKVSYANALSIICERLEANIEDVLTGIGQDKRIGKQFLNSGVGYGGSCFPKDIQSFIHIASDLKYNFEFLKAVEKINQNQIEYTFLKIKHLLKNFNNKTITILGLSFKPNTDDIREAPSLKFISRLLAHKKLTLKIYDPIALDNVKKIYHDNDQLIYCTDPYPAIKNSDLILLVTEWNEFKELDLAKIKKLMRTPNIVDGRNIFDPQKVKSLGFKYLGVGRN